MTKFILELMGLSVFVLNIKNKIMHKKSLNGMTQTSHSRASQFPLPTSTAPWQQWSSERTPTASPTHPSGNPSLLSNPNPIPFSAPTSGIGNHQHSSTMYQALFPSISADGCNKNILKHHKFVTCKLCERICHSKCSDKIYNYNFIDESWCCWECSSKEEARYNPFRSYRYDKYSNFDANNFNEICQIENILENC